MCGICLVVLLCKDIIALILGKNFAQSIYIFPFIMLYPIMYTMSESTAVGIGFSRKTEWNIIISALSGGANIALNYLLIPILDGKGAALATGISYMVFFWGRTLVSRKLWYRFRIGKYILYTLLILMNCYLHTFVIGWLPYVVTMLSLISVVAMNWKFVKDMYQLVKENKERLR